MSSIPPLPTTWIEQRPYIGKVNQLGANNLIAEILAVEPHSSFHFVLCRMIQKLIEENSVLAFENGCTIPKLAWATRNIMELRVLSRFVCQSETNLQRFQNDILTTGATALQSMIRLQNDLAKKFGVPQVPPSLHRNHGELQTAREEAGLGEQTALLASTCAKKVGLEKEYFALSGVTSTLVHPSAISILMTFDLEAYREAVTIHGLMLVSEVIMDARNHIAAYGCKCERP
jgi:hypothetical protein